MRTQTPLSLEDIDRIARKRASAKMGWFVHAAVYVSVNLLLLVLSEYGMGRRHWSVYPVLGWGLGLALHGVSVWLLGSGSDLRERMVQAERERLLRDQDRRGQP